MNMLYHICLSLSAGLLIGFLCGAVKTKLNATRKTYSQKKINAVRRLIKKTAALLKYITFLGLGLGFIWCLYFLILGIAVPAQAEYADNMSELIVSVLTVISILFAFVEFLRKKDDQNE